MNPLIAGAIGFGAGFLIGRYWLLILKLIANINKTVGDFRKRENATKHD